MKNAVSLCYDDRKTLYQQIYLQNVKNMPCLNKHVKTSFGVRLKRESHMNFIRGRIIKVLFENVL